MSCTFKVLSLLLTYPTEEFRAEAPALAAALADEGLLSERRRHALGTIFAELAERDLYDLQERYVTLFDRTRSLSLHLFEHVHGDGRDRGQAMIDLQGLYGDRDMVVAANELPDFLPLFLEFLSTLPVEEAHALLAEPVAILTVLEERLRKRRSVYAFVMQALVALARGEADATALKDLRAADDADPDDLAALDRTWEDSPVTFGPGDQAGCAKDSILARIATRRVPGAARHDKGARP